MQTSYALSVLPLISISLLQCTALVGSYGNDGRARLELLIDSQGQARLPKILYCTPPVRHGEWNPWNPVNVSRGFRLECLTNGKSSTEKSRDALIVSLLLILAVAAVLAVLLMKKHTEDKSRRKRINIFKAFTTGRQTHQDSEKVPPSKSAPSPNGPESSTCDGANPTEPIASDKAASSQTVTNETKVNPVLLAMTLADAGDVPGQVLLPCGSTEYLSAKSVETDNGPSEGERTVQAEEHSGTDSPTSETAVSLMTEAVSAESLVLTMNEQVTGELSIRRELRWAVRRHPDTMRPKAPLTQLESDDGKFPLLTASRHRVDCLSTAVSFQAAPVHVDRPVAMREIEIELVLTAHEREEQMLRAAEEATELCRKSSAASLKRRESSLVSARSQSERRCQRSHREPKKMPWGTPSSISACRSSEDEDTDPFTQDESQPR